MQAGKLSYFGANELLCSTYSGKIIGFMDQKVKDKCIQENIKNNPKETQKRIVKLRESIQKLELELEGIKEQHEYENCVVTIIFPCINFKDINSEHL